MKHQLVLEFDDVNIDGIGLITNFEKISMDGLPCGSLNSFDTVSKTHHINFLPFRLILSLTKEIGKERNFNHYLDDVQRDANTQFLKEKQHA